MIVGHVILISTQVQSRAGVPVLEAVTFGAFARVQQGTAGVVRAVRDSWSHYVYLRGASIENDSLRKQVAELEVRLQEQRALAQKSERLQALLDLRPTVTAPMVAAEVIAGYADAGMLTITIDRGTRDGVMENMAVIAPTGVVGRVLSPVAAHAARVQLIIDENAAVGAVTERSRSGGMVIGWRGDPPLRMDLVSNLADVKPGDLLVTSGADGIYPKGFNIGRVEASERGSQLYRTHYGAAAGRFPGARGSAGGPARAPTRDSRADTGGGRHGEMKAAGVLLALVGALALQTTISGLTMGGARMVNLVVVAVIYVALMFGPVTGLFAGTVGGLAQDALAGGVVGIGSLSKTIIGFFAGLLGAHFIVAQPLPRFVMFVGATVVHEVIFQGLYALIEMRAFRLQYSPLLTQAVINATVGLAAFFIVERGPGLLQRRRARRGRY